MKIAFVILLALSLAACATKPEVQIKEVVNTVKVPVTVPCVTKAPERPQYQFGVGERPTDKEMAAILAEDFEKAEQYGLAWEAAAAGCLIAPRP